MMTGELRAAAAEWLAIAGRCEDQETLHAAVLSHSVYSVGAEVCERLDEIAALIAKRPRRSR